MHLQYKPLKLLSKCHTDSQQILKLTKGWYVCTEMLNSSHAQSGATLMWRHLSAKWRHLECEVAPPPSASGATSTCKWRHFNMQVAPLQDASGATSTCKCATSTYKWRHFNMQVAPLQQTSGATSTFKWRHFTATSPPLLRHFTGTSPPLHFAGGGATSAYTESGKNANGCHSSSDCSIIVLRMGLIQVLATVKGIDIVLFNRH